MLVRLILTAGLFAPGIVGCAAQGQFFDTALTDLTAPPQGQARVLFYRTKDSYLYVARRAMVAVDGNRIGGLNIGGYIYQDLQPGEHRLKADMWDAPGACELVLKADAGDIYYFQVDARNQSFWSFAGPGTGAMLISDNIWIGLAAGLGGMAAESYGKECGGAFKLYPVDGPTAQPKLKGLRYNN